ncbi:unnamed protein product [Calypogeia fissa]
MTTVPMDDGVLDDKMKDEPADKELTIGDDQNEGALEKRWFLNTAGEIEGLGEDEVTLAVWKARWEEELIKVVTLLEIRTPKGSGNEATVQCLPMKREKQ